jgi:long-subunit fatty acid transport protein
MTVKAGAETTAWRGDDGDFLARLGFAFDPSPIPSQRGDTNYLDTDRWIGGLSFGWRWLGVGPYRFDQALVFDVGGQLQYLPPRVAYKRDNVDADNPGYPKVGFHGWLYAVGATFSVPFDYE